MPNNHAKLSARNQDILNKVILRACQEITDATWLALLTPSCVVRRLQTAAGMRPPHALLGVKKLRHLATVIS